MTTNNEHEHGGPDDRMIWSEDTEAGELQAELSHLERLARKALGTADPLRLRLAAALHPFETDCLPDLPEMRAAWDAFQAAPENVRRQVMNGWPVPDVVASATHVVRHGDPVLQVARFASVSAEPGRASVDGIEAWPDRTVGHVMLLIREGTAKDDATAAAAAALGLVSAEWERLTDEPANSAPLPAGGSTRQ